MILSGTLGTGMIASLVEPVLPLKVLRVVPPLVVALPADVRTGSRAVLCASCGAGEGAARGAVLVEELLPDAPPSSPANGAAARCWIGADVWLPPTANDAMTTT